MPGKRTQRLLREDMDRRFFRLGQFLGGYLHQDWPYFHGSPEGAVDQAIQEHPVELQQQVRRELQAVLSEVKDDKRLRDILNDGLGVNILFKKPAEARVFGNSVDAKLLKAIKEHFEGYRMKGD